MIWWRRCTRTMSWDPEDVCGARLEPYRLRSDPKKIWWACLECDLPDPREWHKIELEESDATHAS